ncbi:MAG: RNA methyltransferase [Coxiellaceae bacterium]|nr:RNA methyltransferase [Coxiellaceae bacterium]
MLDHVRIVLVNTSHPGNIGAAARAMKNMGLQHLALVGPAHFPHAEATARASGADDILANAQIYPDLNAAIADCQLVLATSARSRSLPWPLISPREAAEQVMQYSSQSVAIVFGNERVGLSNDELSVAQRHINIPTVEGFSSLNLAAAVQVMAYELFVHNKNTDSKSDEEVRELVTAEQMNGFMQHLADVLTTVEFLNPDHPKLLMKRLQRLFHRASLDTTELNILRGVLSAVDNKVIKSK